LKGIEIKKNTKLLESKMVEPLLTGIVIGLSFVTLLGLFVAAYLQFKRGNELTL
jgi:cytochrome b6-f complex subunit 5